MPAAKVHRIITRTVHTGHLKGLLHNRQHASTASWTLLQHRSGETGGKKKSGTKKDSRNGIKKKKVTEKIIKSPGNKKESIRLTKKDKAVKFDAEKKPIKLEKLIYLQKT